MPEESSQSEPTTPSQSMEVRLDGKQVLDFIEGQNRSNRDYFDKLLRWMQVVIAVGLFVVAGGFAWLGFASKADVVAIHEQTRKTLADTVAAEVTSDRIREAVAKVVADKTNEQFQSAVAVAVEAEMKKPERSFLFDQLRKLDQWSRERAELLQLAKDVRDEANEIRRVCPDPSTAECAATETRRWAAKLKPRVDAALAIVRRKDPESARRLEGWLETSGGGISFGITAGEIEQAAARL